MDRAVVKPSAGDHSCVVDTRRHHEEPAGVRRNGIIQVVDLSALPNKCAELAVLNL
jgi:hypothetical protein